MNISIYDESCEFVREMVEDIAERFLNRLHHRAVFAGKLSVLTVGILARTCLPTTTGSTTLIREEPMVRIQTTFMIGSSESRRHLAYVIAREFAHVLFISAEDSLGLRGRGGDGCFTGESCFHRSVCCDDRGYGGGMEASAAELLARWIISDTDYEDESEAYARELAEDSDTTRLTRFASLFASAYGEPLEGARYIDEYFISECDTAEDDCLEADYCVTVIRNRFWNSVAAGAFSHMVDDYDELMGEDAYRELCENMDYFLEYHYEDNEKGDMAMDAWRCADTALTEFLEQVCVQEE
ncbi:MAG: hypothetical protein IJ493_05110 [Clostridia bacterium]|nr:hypothetical protein [Clostridia bacterium]